VSHKVLLEHIVGITPRSTASSFGEFVKGLSQPQGCLAVLCSRTNVCNYRKRFAIDISHDGDLFIPFSDIVLINT
jgi:hypothetical protein